jgi:uncharacterized protein YlbG (UPF0298 family)
LEIYKDKKLEKYGRIIMPYIVDVIKKNNSFLNIVVSYNLLNNLNFLHLEMFYLGIPIIHNCKPFEENEMYFSDNELLKAVQLIETTRIHFDKREYKEKCKRIIDFFSPNNETRLETYKAYFSKFEKKESLGGGGGDPYVEKPTDIESKEKYSDKESFYQGTGYVIHLKSLDEYQKINKLTGIILSKKETVYMELFVDPKEFDKSMIPFNELLNITILDSCDLYNKLDVIKKSSFEVVHYVSIESESTNDIKIYTK